MPIFIVEKSDAQLTLQEFLQRRIPAAPEAYLRQLLKKGKVLGDDGAKRGDEIVHAGETIRLPDSGRLQELLSAPPAAQQPLAILYESREIMVVDKPAGLAIHSSQGHETDNLTARVAQLLHERGQKFKVAPAHRLDLETSGPVLFGKGKQASAQLGQLFMRQEVAKSYLALVVGKTPGSGRLESTLTAKGKQKRACTDYRALQRNDQASLL